MSSDPTWYATWFGRPYLELYAHRDAREAERATRHLLAPLGLAGRRVLDVGCGGGRFVRAVAVHGAEVVGVDLSPELLAAAAAAGPPATGNLVRADMRALPFTLGAFDIALSMFTSFGYFPTAAEDRLVLVELARVLRPHGDLVIDFLNAEKVRSEPLGTSERRAGAYRVRETRRLEGAGERIVKEIELRCGATVQHYREEVRLWSAADLGAAIAAAGFELLQRWGDYDGTPFAAATSPRLVLHARREPA